MNGLYIILTIVIYSGILLAVSRLTGRNSGNDAFFRGNRNSPWYLVAFGMIGASISGVSVVSVPGMVRVADMTYMQMCLGFFFGYIVIAHVLLPLYYKLNLTSIYSYLGERFGRRSYKTGASFFLLSKITIAAVRLYLVCVILQTFVFDSLHIPFTVTVIVIVLLIWLYTRRGGIKTLVWTDCLQTFCLLLAVILIICKVTGKLGLDFGEAVQAVAQDPHSRIFVFDDWRSTQNFFKQFLSGAFITIVMTGLDQDMMQKNLTCKNLHEAQKNMYCNGISYVPVNLLFLALGVLLLQLAAQTGTALPASGDEILPMFAASGYLGYGVLVLFTIGIISAAFSSADSALTALTTSFCVDILEIGDGAKVGSRTASEAGGKFSVVAAGTGSQTIGETTGTGSQSNAGTAGQISGAAAEKRRKIVHFCISVIFIGIVLLLRAINNKSALDAIYTIVSYTYGPLLGLFAFGLFTKKQPRDRLVPIVAVASPLLCFAIDTIVSSCTGYKFGYEMLMFNGLLTFASLYLLSLPRR